MKKVIMYDGLVVYIDDNFNIISVNNNILKQMKCCYNKEKQYKYPLYNRAKINQHVRGGNP